MILLRTLNRIGLGAYDTQAGTARPVLALAVVDVETNVSSDRHENRTDSPEENLYYDSFYIICQAGVGGSESRRRYRCGGLTIRGVKTR